MSKACVIGAGIVGLWTAEVLSRRGHNVTVCSAQKPEATSSASAACVITPLLPWEHNDPKFLLAWGRYQRTIDKFRSIDKAHEPNAPFLELMPSYECGFTRGGERFLERSFNVKKFEYLPFSTFDIIPIEPPVRVENHVRDVYECDFCVSFLADFCNTETFLCWLGSELARRGVRFELAKLTSHDSLEALATDVIFNCTGSGSAVLFPDTTLIPVRGQSMFIDAEHLDGPYFGIAFGNHAVFKHRRGYYVGSYFIEGPTAFRQYPSDDEYQLSTSFINGPYRELCARLGFECPRIDFGKIRRVNTGHRPFRPDGPRIEAELIRVNSSSIRVVHNYGHGAHGWTVGYATAEDAVNLAEATGWLQF